MRQDPRVILRAAALLVALASVLPYLHTISYPFVWDDEIFITQNEAVRHRTSVANYLADPETLSPKTAYNHMIYRPLRTLLFATLYATFGPNPLPFHLLNLGLHTASALMVLLIGRRLAESNSSALIAALFFAVHPVHAEAVTWISSLADVLSTFVYLAALLVFLMEHPYAKAVAVGLLLPVALLSKEMAITLPLAFLAVSLWSKDGRASLKRSTGLLYIIASFLLAGLYFAWRSYLLGAVGQTSVTAAKVTEALLRGHLVLGEYFWMLLVPHPLCPLRTNILPFNASGSAHGLGTVVVLGLAVVVVKGFQARKPAGLFALFFLMTLLPVLGLIPVSIHVAERFAYLPSAWFCLVAAEGVLSLRRRLADKRAVDILTAALVLALALKLAVVNLQWRSGVAVAFAQVKCERPDASAYWNLGKEASDAKMFRMAAAAYNKFLTFNLHPDTTQRALNNLAHVHVELGEWDTVETLARRCLSSSPDNREALSNLSIALARRGANAEALPIFREIATRWPDFDSHFNLAVASMRVSDFETALTQLRKAIALRPDDPRPKTLLEQVERSPRPSSMLSGPE